MPPEHSAPSPSSLVSLDDYGRAAEELIEPGAFGYYVGGACDEITLRDNSAAWQRLAIAPRVLVGVGQRDPSVNLLGRRRPHPLVIAPMAYQRLAHPDGEIGTARAAAMTGSITCLSTLATTTVQELAEAVPEASRWFQLYVFSDRGVSRELVAQAVEHGYEALVVTVDLPITGLRERDLRSGVQSAAAPQIAGAHAAGAEGVMTPADFVDLVDGGIRRGTDVLKALALGARAVLVGRPALWGLAVEGADGARRVLEILLGEFDTALALAGAPHATDLDRSFLTRAPWAADLQ